MKGCVAIVLFALVLTPVAPAAVERFTQHDGKWTFRVDPGTLEISAHDAAGSEVPISMPRRDLDEIGPIERHDQGVQWSIPHHGLDVHVWLDRDRLVVQLTAAEPGTFEWPSVVPSERALAYVLPMFEGVYASFDDARWVDRLSKLHPQIMTEFSLPAWGVHLPHCSVSYLLPNEFNNKLVFGMRGGTVSTALRHEFTRNHEVKRYSVMICVDEPSPVAVARRYRELFREQGRFVSLEDKRDIAPQIERLFGAFHAYLWGDAILSEYDVLDFQALCEALLRSSESSALPPIQRLWLGLDGEARGLVRDIASGDWPSRYAKRLITRNLARLLESVDLQLASTRAGVESRARSAGARATAASAVSGARVDAALPIETVRRNEQLLKLRAFS